METIRHFRVLHVAACPFPASRGTPVRIRRLVEALAGLGHDVHVASYHLGEPLDAPVFTLHRIPDVPFYNKVTPGPTYLKVIVVDFLLMLKVLQLGREKTFDVIHAHHYEGLLAALPAHYLFGLPLVFDSHTLLQTELPYYELFLPKVVKRWIGAWIDRLLPAMADHVICVSEQQRGIYSHFVGPGELSMVPNGVEVEHFLPGSEKMEDGKGITLGYAGNLAEFQGINLMLDALAILAKEFPDIRLNIYSNDSLMPCHKQLEELGLSRYVHLFPSDFMTLPHQLADASILLSPRPMGDGYPIKLMNYMAAARPVVCFKSAAHDIRHGETGLLVDAIDPRAYASAIRSLILDPKLRVQMGENARRLVENEFSWTVRGKQAQTIYKNLADKKPK